MGLTPPSTQTRRVIAVFDSSCLRAEAHLGSPTVECGSKALDGCDFLHGESHIFLVPCDCRGVSPRPTCPASIGRGVSSEGERRTLSNITLNPGLIFSLPPAMFEHIAGARHNTHEGQHFAASNADRMLAIFFRWFFSLTRKRICVSRRFLDALAYSADPTPCFVFVVLVCLLLFSLRLDMLRHT